MTESGLRLITILENIPRYPKSISAQEMLDRLNNIDAELGSISTKQIKRNIESLQSANPYVVNKKEVSGSESTRENRYCLHPDAPNKSYSKMEPSTAVTLLLGYEQLKALLPYAVQNEVKPFIKEAKSVLSSNANNGWNNKVRILHNSPLQTADIKPQNFSVIYEALLEGKQFKAKYRDGSSATYNPLGLVQRGQSLYLVCSYDGKDKAYVLALHRFNQAERLNKKYTTINNFDLDAYIKTGALDWNWNKEQNIKLKLSASPWLKSIIEETPLHKNQKIKLEKDSGSFTITAPVIDNHELRSWLLGLRNEAEVLAPKKLREWIKNSLQETLALYGD